jgi:hypothetical protein
MSSQDYLKQAAAMLRRAALERKHEADELRHHLDQKERERQDLLKQKEQERVRRLDEAAISNSDAEKGSKVREAQILSVEKGQIDKDYNYQKRQLDEQLNNMQRSVDDINQMAQGLGG